MDKTLAQTIGLGAMTAVLTIFVARVDAAPVDREAGGTVAADSTAVRGDSAIDIKWLTDANVLALISTINGRQIAASNIMMASAHSDTVRALATSLARAHTDLQRSADSIASSLRIVPAPPALTAQVNAEFQAQIDSMLGNGGAALDRAYLARQAISHKLMGDYLDQLAGVAQQPELSAWITAASARVAAERVQVQGQQRALVVADSIVADSLAKRAASRKKR